MTTTQLYDLIEGFFVIRMISLDRKHHFLSRKYKKELPEIFKNKKIMSIEIQFYNPIMTIKVDTDTLEEATNAPILLSEWEDINVNNDENYYIVYKDVFGYEEYVIDLITMNRGAYCIIATAT